MSAVTALEAIIDAACAELRACGHRKEAGELFAFDSCPGGNDVCDAERWADWLRPFAKNEWMPATRKALELLEGLADLQAWFAGLEQLAAIVDDYRETAERPALAKTTTTEAVRIAV